MYRSPGIKWSTFTGLLAFNTGDLLGLHVLGERNIIYIYGCTEQQKAGVIYFC